MLNAINTMPAWLVVSESVAVTFGLVMAGYGLWQMRRDRLQEARQLRRLQQQPTRPMPTLPSQPAPLPIVRPAQAFDHSDKTPYVGNCPECYVLWLQSEGANDPRHRTSDGGYLMPKGPPMLCTNHADCESTLGRAILRKAITSWIR